MQHIAALPFQSVRITPHPLFIQLIVCRKPLCIYPRLHRLLRSTNGNTLLSRFRKGSLCRAILTHNLRTINCQVGNMSLELQLEKILPESVERPCITVWNIARISPWAICKGSSDQEMSRELLDGCLCQAPVCLVHTSLPPVNTALPWILPAASLSQSLFRCRNRIDVPIPSL